MSVGGLLVVWKLACEDSAWASRCRMADTISKTFVMVLLLDYLVMFGILVHWTVRTWLPKPSKTSASQSSHGIAQPH